MVSLICCDKEFSEKDEDKRKILHDDILNELGINQQMEYCWQRTDSKIKGAGNYVTNLPDNKNLPDGDLQP